MLKLISFILFLIISFPAFATTYYVRGDGGTDSQCTGTTNAAYPGSGSAQACAYSHPFYAFGWAYEGTTEHAGNMSGGDTVIIDAATTYKMSYGSGWSGCNPGFKGDCNMLPPPSGADVSHKTKIYGSNYLSCGARSQMTKLYGGDFMYQGGVISLGASTSGVTQGGSGANYIDIECLDISDHDQCTDIPTQNGGNVINNCSDSARAGIKGRSNGYITLKNVYIHGFANVGIQDANANNWDFHYVTVENNGLADINFDGDNGDNTNVDVSGSMILDHVIVDGAGCGETYPGIAKINCTGQDSTYYPVGNGDGVAFGNGTIGQWTITDSYIGHNTQDGFDGLHGFSGTDFVHSARSIYEGNDGQQFKVNASVNSENDFFVGDCQYFAGQSFTNTDWAGSAGDYCRASGNTISLGLHSGTVANFYGDTILSIGDVVFSIDGGSSGCDSTTHFNIRNSTIIAGRQWGDDSTVSNGNPSPGNDTTSFYYSSGSDTCASFNYNEDYNQIYGVKEGSGIIQGAHSRYGDPLFSGTIHLGPTTYSSDDSINKLLYLSASSPSRFSVTGANSADETLTFVSNGAIDNNSFSRGTNWDGGAVEYGSTVQCVSSGGACNLNTDCCSGVCSVSTNTCASGTGTTDTFTGNLTITGITFK